MRISDWSSDVCSSDLLLRARLRRAGAGHLAQHRAAVAVDLGRRLAAVVAGLPAGRHRGPAAGDPGLHVLVVFGVPGQGRGGFGVSLIGPGLGIGDWGFGIQESGARCLMLHRERKPRFLPFRIPNSEYRIPAPPMHAYVYKSLRKADTYVYLAEREDFERLPEPLRAQLEPLRFVLDVALVPGRKLAREIGRAHV